MIDLNEAIQKIKKVGPTNARAVPMPGKRIDEEYQIEVREYSTWRPIVSGITKQTAEGIIQQAINRLICG